MSLGPSPLSCSRLTSVAGRAAIRLDALHETVVDHLRQIQLAELGVVLSEIPEVRGEVVDIRVREKHLRVDVQAVVQIQYGGVVRPQIMREPPPHGLAVLGIFRPMRGLAQSADEAQDEMAVAIPKASRDDNRAADHSNAHGDRVGHHVIGNFAPLQALDGGNDAAQYAGAKRGGSLDAAAGHLHEFHFLRLDAELFENSARGVVARSADAVNADFLPLEIRYRLDARLHDKFVLRRLAARDHDEIDASNGRLRRGLGGGPEHREIAGEQRRQSLSGRGDEDELRREAVAGEKARVLSGPKRDTVAADRGVADLDRFGLLGCGGSVVPGEQEDSGDERVKRKTENRREKISHNPYSFQRFLSVSSIFGEIAVPSGG